MVPGRDAIIVSGEKQPTVNLVECVHGSGRGGYEHRTGHFGNDCFDCRQCLARFSWVVKVVILSTE